MMSLTQTFVLTSGNNQIRVTQAGGAGSATITVPVGTYTRSSFRTALTTAMDAALGGPFTSGDQTQASPVVFTLSTALGGGDGAWSLDFSHGDWTLDPRILGFPAAQSSDVSSETGAGSAEVITSDYTPRYGWYPQQPAWDPDFLRLAHEGIVEVPRGRGGYDVQHISSYREGELVVELVAEGYMVEDVMNDSRRMTSAGLLVDDENASLERFLRDHIETGSTITFRPTAHSSTDEVTGLVVLNEAVRQKPLVLCDRKALVYTAKIPLVEL